MTKGVCAGLLTEAGGTGPETPSVYLGREEKGARSSKHPCFLLLWLHLNFIYTNPCSPS